MGSRAEGCFLCAARTDERIALAEQGVVICRPCVTRVSEAIVRASPTLVARLWRDAVPPPRDANEASVMQEIGDDAVVHFDLAVAYDQAGLVADAVREAARALGGKAPLAFTARVLSWLFARNRARPDAWPTIARMC
jgi:hypothetical protein